MTPRWSIRRRLLLPLLALLLLGLGGAPLVASYVVGDFFQKRGEERVRAVSTIVGGIVSGRDRVVVDADRFAQTAGLTDMVVVALDSAGAPVATLDRLVSGVEGLDPDSLGADLAQEAPGDGVVARTVAGRPFLLTSSDVSGLVIRTDDGREVEVARVVAAYDRSGDIAVVRRQETVGYGFAVTALVVLGVVAAVVLRRGLRPLEQMADRVGDQQPGDLAGIGRSGGLETARLGVALDEAFAARSRAEEALRDFVADASHELRTPLTTMGGWLDLWAQGGLDDDAERDAAMSRIEAEVGRMRLLVEDLGLLARLDRGRPLAREVVDLASLMSSVVADARVVAPDRDLRLDVSGHPEVLGDGPRLMQVFRNVVGNAVQHTPAGTPVKVTVRSGPGGVVVDVRDHGPGIPPADLERVFERFHRSGHGRRDEGGSGLGLAIVRSITEAHGGRAAAAPAPGGGTVVSIELPTVSQSSGRS